MATALSKQVANVGGGIVIPPRAAGVSGCDAALLCDVTLAAAFISRAPSARIFSIPAPRTRESLTFALETATSPHQILYSPISSTTPRFVNSSTCFLAGRFIRNAGGGQCLLCVP